MMDEVNTRGTLRMTSEARAEQFGELHDPYEPQAELFNHATGLLAMMDQYDVDYDDGSLETELKMFADRIVEDVMCDIND